MNSKYNLKQKPNLTESSDEHSFSEEEAHDDLKIDIIKLFEKGILKMKGFKYEQLDTAPADPALLCQVPFILLFFSAHWCPPCRGMLPDLKEFYE